ncbi:NYN domain-containing protein [Vibrio harveyi]|nr:NYN domain-containing protein [Vibrio harveyi]
MTLQVLPRDLEESENHVIGVGKAMTPTSFKNACDDFVAIENLNADVELGEHNLTLVKTLNVNFGD